MSRVALCISGQYRFYRESYSNIYINIIKEHNCDVFLHTWYSKDILAEAGPIYVEETKELAKIDSNILNNLSGLYQPKDILIEDSINFEGEIIDKYERNNISYNNTLSMFYSIYKANELKKKYEEKHKFTYDNVIKARYDLRLEDALQLNKNDGFNVDAIPDGSNINDLIYYGSSEVMDTASNLIYNLELPDHLSQTPSRLLYVNHGNIFLKNEHNLIYWLEKNNIKIYPQRIVQGFYARHKTTLLPPDLKEI